MLPWPLKDDGGGVNQVVLNLAAECLSEEALQPLVVECNWGAPLPARQFLFPVEPLKDTSIDGGAEIPWHWRSLFQYLVHLPRVLYQLRQIGRRHRVVAFNAQFVGLNSVNLVLAKKLGLIDAAVVLTFQGDDTRIALRAQGLRRTLYQWMLRHADAVVACSQGLMEEVSMIEPRLRRQVVIHNAIHVDRLSCGHISPVSVREPGTELIVNVGRYEHRKGHDLIIRSFVEIARSRPAARLWIVGMNGPAYQETSDLVQQLQLSDKVTLFRDIPHERIAQMMQQANVFVFASRWIKGVMGEGLPLAVLEAGLLGLPVVSTRTCGIGEILIDQENGRVVELDNVPELTSALTDMLDHPVRARQFGAKLRHLLSTQYTVRRAWESYRSLSSLQER